MSLDVYLNLRICIREEGSDKEEIIDSEVFTHAVNSNLSNMAEAAGIGECLWCPIENGITKAEQLVSPLENGIQKLKSDPEWFKKLNPLNGCGTYEELLEFAEVYLAACETYPNASIQIWK